jgi:threonine/homoserine/homoserine lactone efflux protein
MLSPGPANLVSFAFGARFGFVQILPFLFGVSVVYIFVALALGVGTNHLMGQHSGFTDLIRFFGGVFIVYLGIQLLRRKNQNISTKAPSIWNGIVLQILNPKYPPVVLSVFAASQNQDPFMTAGILAIVGMAGLLVYAISGAVIHHKVNRENQFGTVDLVFGVMLCFVGFWLLVKPVGG